MTRSDLPDDDLRALLRNADPASDLPPLEPDRILRMVNQTTSQPPTPGGAPLRAPRRPLLLGLAGVTGLAAATFAVVSALTPAAISATRIALPAGDGGMAAGSCAVLSPGVLAPLPLAFEGTVKAVGAEVVTLQVTRVFRGQPGSTVEIERPELSEGDFSAFDFVAGAGYLISVHQAAPPATAEIALCGLSGPDSPELRAVYEEAFR